MSAGLSFIVDTVDVQDYPSTRGDEELLIGNIACFLSPNRMGVHSAITHLIQCLGFMGNVLHSHL